MSRKIYGRPIATPINPNKLVPDVSEDIRNALEEAKASGEFDGADGKDGYTPVKGVDYFDGKDGVDGYTPQKGIDYFDGQPGANGKDGSPGKDGEDGVSVTHEWNGTVLKVTSASGTSSADLKGEPGKDGKDGAPGSDGADGQPGKDGTSPVVSVSAITGGHRITITDSNGTKTVDVMNGADGAAGKDGANGTNGTNGKDGASVTVKSVSESTADGGSNVVTFSDGKTLTVKNGKAGTNGTNGKTPVKGSDYFTDADKEEFLREMDAVRYSEQTLTEAQKEQARRNIGITASGENTIPDYWISELETKAEAIQLAMETAGRNKSAFLWYTDAHWPTNSKMSPVLLDYLCKNTSMNRVNFGGDIVGDPSPYNHENTKYVYDWRSKISNLPNHHSVYGNHDVYHRAANVNNIAYAHLLASEETADMVVGGESYYYIDNPSEKTRYLYLAYIAAGAGFADSDTAAEMVAQGKFITDSLISLEEGWHVVAIAHRWYQYTKDANNQLVIEGGSFPFYEAEILRVFDAYNARLTTHASPNYIVPVDCTNAKGKVEFCIGGHCHLDYDFTTDGGVPVIITASDTNQERNTGEDEDNGILGTTSESAVFGIIADYTDAENTKITVVGVGRGTSRVIGGTVEPERRILNLDRTYVSGTVGEELGSNLDESKAYLNVNRTVTETFYEKSCTVSNVTEDGVTITESGAGGITVAYPIYLPDISSNPYRMTFDYSGPGKCRSYYRYYYAGSGVASGHNDLYINDTAGATGSTDVIIPALSGAEWLVIYLTSNTGNTKTFTNVTLTKA